MTDRVFMTRLALSAVTMLACCAVFCSTTLAYFTSNQSVGVSAIQAAETFTNVSVQDDEIGTCSSEDTVTYTCPLTENDLHTFTLTADGTASESYCVLNIGDETYSTETLENGDSMEITVQAAEGTKIIFNSNWGEYEGTQSSQRSSAIIRVSKTPYEQYKVQEGVTLSDLSKYYGVSKEDILVYNGITELTVGKTIKIPNTSVTTPYEPEEKKAVETKAQTEPAEETVQATEPSQQTEPIDDDER